MEIKFNVTGADRKALVKAISDIICEPPKYLGAPSFAYKIGDYYTVSKSGELTISDEANEAQVTTLTEELYRRGFEGEHTAAAETVNNDGAVIEIQIPKADFSETTVENLKKLAAAKGNLIKAALGIDTLEIKEYDDRIGFPWFKSDTPSEDIQAYTEFLAALTNMAKEQKRITAKEKEVDNKKYAFRCFLLRLGFIGAEYKTTRKILLRNLDGSSAFKSSERNEAVVND